MENCWPSFKGPNSDLWLDEYAKHGARTPFKPEHYFNFAVKLYEQLTRGPPFSSLYLGLESFMSTDKPAVDIRIIVAADLLKTYPGLLMTCPPKGIVRPHLVCYGPGPVFHLEEIRICYLTSSTLPVRCARLYSGVAAHQMVEL
ncbi:hypothetical protein CASFOL_036998 [Castilleja foliolosa]|uniref:Uncharacterized protein n=1 Tax=Castilleja foliolosa TaxID=1961234 RepID=A0ABD3BQD2_9LAMI